MLGVEPATLRAWEDRYGIVVPTRNDGAQRVYSRDELERLRFIVNTMAKGSTAADAHRLLGEQLGTAEVLTRPDGAAVTIVVLLAERDRYAAELCEYFLRTEGYDVCMAFEADAAERIFAERTPGLAVVELMISGGGVELCRKLAGARAASVLAVSALNLADEALAVGASAYLPKPFDPLHFVSTVRDLLGASALTRRVGAEVG
jgi:DNA-binding transcriptional MerR regulator